MNPKRIAEMDSWTKAFNRVMKYLRVVPDLFVSNVSLEYEDAKPVKKFRVT